MSRNDRGLVSFHGFWLRPMTTQGTLRYVKRMGWLTGVLRSSLSVSGEVFC